MTFVDRQFLDGQPERGQIVQCDAHTGQVRVVTADCYALVGFNIATARVQQ